MPTPPHPTTPHPGPTPAPSLPLSPLSRAQKLCMGSHLGLCCFAEWAGGDARLHCAGAFASCIQFCLLVEASLLQQAWGKFSDYFCDTCSLPTLSCNDTGPKDQMESDFNNENKSSLDRNLGSDSDYRAATLKDKPSPKKLAGSRHYFMSDPKLK